MSLEEKNLVIGPVDDITRCVNLASLLELAGWPKPGNVHRTMNFKDTRFEHYLAAIAAIQPNFREFCHKVYKYSMNVGEDYSFVKMGNFFKDASKEMMKWQNGGNVILGHILILAPLAAAASICLKSERTKFKQFIFNVKKTIDDATVYDTINLYEAIGICKPGGLGKVAKYDVNDENSIMQIKADKVVLKKIFELSKDHDGISLEYSTGFSVILNEGLPYFFESFKQSSDVNTSVVNTFLKILSDHPDTLIVRKSGLDAAKSVSAKASEILKNGGISAEKGLKLTLALDKELQEKKGKMNPGTTADLVSGVIFCALLFGLKL